MLGAAAVQDTYKFAATTCARCPFAAACVRTPSQGRTISIHPYEHQLQAAAERRQQSDFPALMAMRPTIERKQAHLNRKGSNRTRYNGLRKARLQLFWSAAVVNIERLMVIGHAIAGLVTLETAIAERLPSQNLPAALVA